MCIRDRFEFGPVTFPASPDATANVRSLTDDFIETLHHDPRFVARMTERVGPAVVERMLAATGSVLSQNLPVEPGAVGHGTRTKSQRLALARLRHIN